MGVLGELGFGADEARGMLIEPPDAVLAEAAGVKPRPSIVSSVMTAEPAALVAWWPERGRLDTGSVSRLHWMVSTSKGAAWIVFDPADEDTVTATEIRDAITGSGFTEGEERTLSNGDVAVQLLA